MIRATTCWCLIGGAGPLHAAQHRRGARHRDDRGAAGSRHHLGLWAHRLGLRAVREHDAPGGRRRCAPPVSLREVFADHARRGRSSGRRRAASRDGSSCSLTRGDALRRPGLRGAGRVRGDGARKARRQQRRAPAVRRGAPARLFFRWGGRQSRSNSCRSGSASSRRCASCRCSPRAGQALNGGAPIRIFDRQGLARWPACCAVGARRRQADRGTGADRGPDLDALCAGGLDGARAMPTTTPFWSGE